MRKWNKREGLHSGHPHVPVEVKGVPKCRKKYKAKFTVKKSESENISS